MTGENNASSFIGCAVADMFPLCLVAQSSMHDSAKTICTCVVASLFHSHSTVLLTLVNGLCWLEPLRFSPSTSSSWGKQRRLQFVRFPAVMMEHFSSTVSVTSEENDFGLLDPLQNLHSQMWLDGFFSPFTACSHLSSSQFRWTLPSPHSLSLAVPLLSLSSLVKSSLN